MHSLAAGTLGNCEVPKRYVSSRLNLYSPRQSVKSDNTETNKKKVTINISGMVYETFESTLNKYPETLLGTSIKRSLLTNKRSGQIYLDRHRAAFDAILFYYQSSGYLIRPANVPMCDFETECKYFDIPKEAVKRMKTRDGFLHKRDIKLPGYKSYKDFQYMLWQFFEHPKEFRNVSAMIYFSISFTIIIISIAIFCVESEVVDDLHGETLLKYYHIQNMIEIGVNIFLAFELLLRFYVFPDKNRFFKKPINMIELISLLLFFLAYWCPPHVTRTFALNLSRMMRAFRIARLARVSLMIKTSILVFQSSVNDILAVWYTILIICILCGSIMYYIEMLQPNTKFTSIPMSMWWAMQTVLCLGYGDIVPTSVLGKIIGSIMLYYGVVTVMVLVLALGSRFFDMYAKFLNKDGWLPEENEKEDYEIHY